MIVIVPVTVSMPAVIVLVPPFAVCFPASLTRFAQVMPSVFRLVALITVVLDGLMQSVICARHLSLTVVVVRTHSRCRGQDHTPAKRHRRHEILHCPARQTKRHMLKPPGLTLCRSSSNHVKVENRRLTSCRFGRLM